MGSMSIWHWIVVIAVVLLLFGRGKISDLMGDVAQGIKAFKKGMSEDEKPTADKAEPMKTIDANSQGSAPQPSDVNRQRVDSARPDPALPGTGRLGASARRNESHVLAWVLLQFGDSIWRAGPGP